MYVSYFTIYLTVVCKVRVPYSTYLAQGTNHITCRVLKGGEAERRNTLRQRHYYYY